MANYRVPPQGEQTSLGIVKETTPGVFPGMTNALYHRATNAKLDGKNVPVPRTGAAKKWGQELPGTGPYESTLAIDVESAGDKVGQLLAYSLGGQTTPSTNIVNLTLSGSTLVGATAFPVGSNLPINVVPGMTLTFDTSTNQETLVVANPAITTSGGVYSINTTAGATKAHSNGVGVTLTGVNAYYTKMTLGQLPTFSAQIFRVNDTVDALGCMMETVSITMNSKGGLDFKFTAANMNEAIDNSPATPAFSSKFPFEFENPANWQVLGGAMVGVPGSSVMVKSLSAQISNNLDKSYYSGSSGRNPYAFVQQSRNVKGSVMLGFEDNTAYQLFLGASGATGPKFPVAATSFAWVCAGSDIIDVATGTPYLITLQFPNIWPTGDPVEIKSTGVIMQQFNFEAAESASQTNDDITIHHVGVNSAIF